LNGNSSRFNRCRFELLSSQRERTPSGGDCYRFVLTQPDVDVCLTGPATAQHVDEALEALRRGPMTAEELEWMRRVGRAV